MSSVFLDSSAVVPTVRELATEERSALAALGSRVSADPVTDPEAFGRQARLLARELPQGLAETLWAFEERGSDSGVLVLRGLDVGDLPPTPPDNTGGVGGRTLLARQQAVVSHALGHMVGYAAEGHGHLLQDMVPNAKLAATQQSQGSRVELEAHTEQCFSALRPDYVVLGCLRGDADAATYAFRALDLLGHVDPTEVMELFRPLWTTLVDESFADFLDTREVRGPFSILSGEIDDPTMLIDQDLMHGITKRAQALLERVLEIYVAHRHAVVLQPGDVLLLDNLRAMHGRSPFTPRFDGTDRFISRGFVVRDLRRSRFARPGGGRVVQASFS
ncbi:TfdA family taurine catabolism dioxygenase TauD [Kineococcus rhizosphaerae]|uniref:TfdA family taurine catabolism dioxygenase TauD n=1 Tax=Kineococcus rhizosphaerae TaxID=559628 RepID=A0A2T0R1Q3_9ACTN|nr:TfdA family taurine catabolism dioxygenase TauD [Kineococcus rhizosphaerae]